MGAGPAGLALFAGRLRPGPWALNGQKKAPPKAGALS